MLKNIGGFQRKGKHIWYDVCALCKCDFKDQNMGIFGIQKLFLFYIIGIKIKCYKFIFLYQHCYLLWIRIDKFIKVECFFFFWVHISLGEFNIDHPTKVSGPLISNSTYKGFTRSPTNRVFTTAAGIKLASLWDMSQFLTNCTNRHCQYIIFIIYHFIFI